MSEQPHKPNLEGNKIFAAVVLAMLVGMLAGFVASKMVAPHELEKAVLDIDTSALEAPAGAAAAPVGPEPILALLAKADVAQGERIAKACAACHSFTQGGANGVGPNLWGIVNNKKGHANGFAYSDGLLATAKTSATWTYQSLNSFLWKPQAYAAGTKMSFVGLKKPEDRAAVIAWLRTLAPSPAAMPSDADIAAEAPKEETPAAEAKEEAKEGEKADKPAAKTETK
jgi:cytochrome c